MNVNPGLQLEDVTQETLQAILKVLGGDPLKYIPGYGVVQKDITTATGLTAYNLEPAAKLLVPAITPLRNLIPRVANTRGGTAANWKVITALDTNRVDVFTAEATKAATVSYSVTNKAASYATISKGDNFSFQAQWAGLTFEDVRARGIARLLRHVLIHEEQAILGGNVSELVDAGGAGVAFVAPTTGTSANANASLGGHTYKFKYRAITNLGRGKLSSASGAVADPGAANAVVATVGAANQWVEGAVRYDWYVQIDGAGNYCFQGSTQINSFMLLSFTADSTKVAGVKPGLGDQAPADNSADSLAYDGLIKQLSAANGTTVTTLANGTAGVGTQLQLSDVDTTLQSIWDNWRANPDVMFVSSEQSIRITNLVLAAAGAPTLYVDSGSGNKAEIVGGYRVSHYINKATGKPIPIVTHPYLQKGSILILTTEMPFPASDIANPIEMETRQEYLQLDYPVVAPKWEYEVMVDEVLKVFFPGGCGIIRNIAPGA